MPSDTVWVAMIGGGVTVASLGVQGWLTRGAEKRRYEREDKHRAEDLALSTAEARRKHYAELLNLAEQLGEQLQELEILMDAESDDVPNAWEQVSNVIKANRTLFTRTQVLAPRRAVVNLQEKMRSAALHGALIAGFDDWAEAEVQREIAATAASNLAGEVRRDLGYDGASRESLGKSLE